VFVKHLYKQNIVENRCVHLESKMLCSLFSGGDGEQFLLVVTLLTSF
jgi:hypothetical protein